MKKALIAAKIANGRSMACANCTAKLPNSVCNPANMSICRRAFIEGFRKGAKWYRKNLWHDASKESPKKNKPLLIYLSNGLLVKGYFSDRGYIHPTTESFVNENICVIKWLYIKDLINNFGG